MAMDQDFTQLRERLLAVQDRLDDIRAEAVSHDGMVRATVDGRGLIVGLDLHPSIDRTWHSAGLADLIVDTIHHATRLAADTAAEAMTEGNL